MRSPASSAKTPVYLRVLKATPPTPRARSLRRWSWCWTSCRLSASSSICSVVTITITETGLELNLCVSVFGAGVGTIPWLLLGELCPSKVKGIASGVTVSVAFVMIFAVVKIFPYGLEYLSPAGTYGFFAGVRML